MAATFVLCSSCGKVHEVEGIDQLPTSWRRTHADLFCPHCMETPVPPDDHGGDVVAEEVIFSARAADTLDEVFNEEDCEICGGTCRGH